MKVLVTGANGFIGRALVHRLAHDDRLSVRAAVRRPAQFPPGVEQTPGDLEPGRNWNDSLEGVTHVVHLAARVHMMRDTAPDPALQYHRVNVDGTMALARSAVAAGVRRFVYLSSLKVNGESGLFTERDRPSPRDEYAISKHEAELMLRELAQQGTLEAVIIRPPLVYGQGVGANFAQLIRAVGRGMPLPLGAVRNHRSFVGVDNLVDFIVTCLDHPAAANETFLVSDGDDLSTPELVRRLARAMERPARLIPVPPLLLRLAARAAGRRDAAERLLASLQADISKARGTLSWSPPVTVDEGLARTVRPV